MSRPFYLSLRCRISIMERLVRSILFLVLILVFSPADAQDLDTITVRYVPGHPTPSQSTEWVDGRIERMGVSTRSDTHDIDRFFDSVEATLAQYRITRDWQIVIPDAPYIEILIDLHGRRIQLSSAHVTLERDGTAVVTERGVESLNHRSREAVLSQQSEAFRRHRLAFDRLLSLIVQRMGARFSP